MATIRQRKSGKWQAMVRLQGVSTSKTFTQKTDAKAWARSVEVDVERQTYRATSPGTLGDLLDVYENRVLKGQRGYQQSRYRYQLLRGRLQGVLLKDVTRARLCQYRDQRLQEVSPGTVRREMSILLRALKVAVQEWGYQLPEGVPAVILPRDPRGRQRRLEVGEQQRLVGALGPTLGQLVVFALETAMRRGELLAMQWQDVDFERRLLHIPVTKTGTPRTIPLSELALGVLLRLPRRTDGQVWGLKGKAVTKAFTKACARAGLLDLRFHDLRHEATSRLFERGLQVQEVQLVTGHADLRSLQRYTHLRPQDLLEKLG